MSTDADLIRQVTTDEVERYREDGWVKLDSLVPRTAVDEMLEMAQRLSQSPLREGSGPRVDNQAAARELWNEIRFLARDQELDPFRSLTFSNTIGRNAQLLMETDEPVRYWSDILACKVPQGEEGESIHTGFHQDLPNYSQDRVGTLTFWIALAEVRPQQAGLRFLTGSHRVGPLGRGGRMDQIEQYPWLQERYPMSPELHLQPGDATVHHGLTVHGTGPNTKLPRWSYILTYFPDDVLFNGSPYSNTNDLDLEVGQRFDHPRFDVVYG